MGLIQTTAAVAVMKSLLLLFNLIFWIVGIALLGIGIWMKVDLYKYMEISDDISSNVPWIFIITGIIIVVVCFFACFCFVQGNRGFLYFYSLFLVVVFMLLVIGGIFAYIYRDRFIDGFEGALSNAIEHYGEDKEMTKAIDLVQETLSCCGVNGTDSWQSYSHLHDDKLPSSCCNQTVTCLNTSIDVHTRGCYELVINNLKSNIGVVGGAAVGISMFIILVVLLSLCLANNLSKNQYESV